MRQTLHEAINTISKSLKMHFAHVDLDVVQHIEKRKMLAAYNDATSKDDIAQGLQRFKSLIRFDVLAEELAHVHFYIKLCNKKSTRLLKKVRMLSKGA